MTMEWRVRVAKAFRKSLEAGGRGGTDTCMNTDTDKIEIVKENGRTTERVSVSAIVEASVSVGTDGRANLGLDASSRSATDR